jgi:CD109 antigen
MYGLGLTRQPTKLSVFQPFFVTTNLPYSIKRGEVVSIPVLVFNYMDSDHEAEVTLFNSDAEFEFTEVNEDENQVSRPKRSKELQRKKRVMVKSQSGVTVSFMIRPLKVGHIKIKVTGTTDVAGDGLERQLIVEPEGVTQFKNKAVLVDLRSGADFSTELSIEVPNNAVRDSTRVEVSAVGDILGPTLENLDMLM